MAGRAGKVGPFDSGRCGQTRMKSRQHCRAVLAKEAEEAGGPWRGFPPQPPPWDEGQQMLGGWGECRRDGTSRWGGCDPSPLPAPTSLSVSICKMGLVAIVRFKLDDVGKDTSCGA